MLLALLASVALLLTACGGPDGPGHAGGGSSDAASPDWARGLAVVSSQDLPAEARETLGLIDAGGPFRHDKDGSIFGNYEERLPHEARGYYREYTVPTPGARDRGARRIVAGEESERYYTSDHYESFKAVVNP